MLIRDAAVKIGLIFAFSGMFLATGSAQDARTAQRSPAEAAKLEVIC